MESMTGYAVVEKSTEQFSFSVEIKSVNSKYIETYINLPRMMKDHEYEIELMLKKRYSRGKIELSIDIHDWLESRPFMINRELLRKYYREVGALVRELGASERFSIDALLPLEGVVQKERSTLSEKSRADIFAGIEQAMDRHIRMRLREGAATGKDLLKSLASIARALSKIEKLSRGVSRAMYEKLRAALEQIMKERPEDTRLYTEAAILADRQDINEEVQRLRDHIEKFKHLASADGQTGKQLDFLAQEMFREINTISSKSASSQIAHLVVEIKNSIDKIREQCRNIA
ncbi:MAG TPA: YicC family protein [Spirochaetota bacterium]|nr:YicC family protein [Spirochaetota bacterium]HPI14018.1 YicC family protein [Spirochaetota bacterium]HPV96934.1 YicC family protein [Spirochaetota bacterium]